MSEPLGRTCLLLAMIALAFLGSCGHRVARPPVAAKTGIVFEPAPAELGGGDFGSECGQPLASSAGLYMIGGQRAPETAVSEEQSPSQRVTLRGVAPFSKQLKGAVWLVGAAHPLRPELVLLGGHVRPFPELGPEAPEVGVFALKLNAQGEVVWRRSVADSDPEKAEIASESLALDAEGRLLLLSTGSHRRVATLLGGAGSSADEADSLERIELPGRNTLLWRAGKGDPYGAFAVSDGGAVYLAQGYGDWSSLSRLDPAGNMVWQRKQPFWIESVAEDRAGGVWVGARVYETPSRSSARAFHYDRNGQLSGEFSIGDARARLDRRPMARQTIRQFVVDRRGRLWVSGVFTDSMTLGGFRLYTPEFYGHWFLALLDRALEPRSVLALERQTEVALRRAGDRVLVVHEDADQRCSVHSLGGPE
jgi:hypothetical protein